MRLGIRTGIVLLLVGLMPSAWAVTVNGVRSWPAPDHTRLVFDLNAPVEHSLFTLSGPDRIVIDLKSTNMKSSIPALHDDRFIQDIRYARRGNDDLRIVLDLKRKVNPKSFVLKPHREYGHRLVVDLLDSSQATQRKPVLRQSDLQDKPRDVIVAIDAGHGGDDPGAIGRYGTKEKNVVLGIARELKKLIDAQPGMQGKLIRDGDYFIALKSRVEKARDAQADLFISIHADAFKNRSAHGSSVYVLSEHGASSEVARFLAESENNSDLMGGVLENKEDLLKQVLVDMLKNSTMEESNDVAVSMLKGLRGVTHLHKSHVEQAGFRVLKSPDIPSVLIETAFISNPAEEKKLRSRSHQRTLARAIFKGTLNYFKTNAPMGTLLAMKSRQHRIASGDTLSELAQRYQVSIADLRRANDIQGDQLQIGQILTIPAFSTSDS